MFQFPSFLSLILDAACVVVYFDDPTILNDNEKILSNDFDPFKSYLLIAIFAGK